MSVNGTNPPFPTVYIGQVMTVNSNTSDIILNSNTVEIGKNGNNTIVDVTATTLGGVTTTDVNLKADTVEIGKNGEGTIVDVTATTLNGVTTTDVNIKSETVEIGYDGINSIVDVKATTLNGVTTTDVNLKADTVELGKNGNNTIMTVNAITNLVQLQPDFSTKITNLGDGLADNDAVNIKQLKILVNYINNLNKSLALVSRSIYGSVLNDRPATVPYTVTEIPSTTPPNYTITL